MAKVNLSMVALKKAICDAVWSGDIDQMYTREVAERFKCSTATAKRILDAIVERRSGDERFTNSYREDIGVIISTGSQFIRNVARDEAHNARHDTGAVLHTVWFTIGADE